MVAIEVILDGSTDGPGETLELPSLRGEVTWRDLLDPEVPVGSETAIASILGWRPTGAVDRGAVEAAARGLEWEGVRRLDLVGGHKLLVPDGCDVAGPVARAWPPGLVPPQILDGDTVVIGALGAATGLAALMGARVVVPDGATGAPGSDLAAKRDAALAALAEGARRVVVHVGGADTAAHQRDRDAKGAVLLEADRVIIGPLMTYARDHGAGFSAGPDHGCDPVTGEHVGGPVPWVHA